MRATLLFSLLTCFSLSALAQSDFERDRELSYRLFQANWPKIERSLISPTTLGAIKALFIAKVFELIDPAGKEIFELESSDKSVIDFEWTDYDDADELMAFKAIGSFKIADERYHFIIGEANDSDGGDTWETMVYDAAGKLVHTCGPIYGTPGALDVLTKCLGFRDKIPTR